MLLSGEPDLPYAIELARENPGGGLRTVFGSASSAYEPPEKIRPMVSMLSSYPELLEQLIIAACMPRVRELLPEDVPALGHQFDRQLETLELDPDDWLVRQDLARYLVDNTLKFLEKDKVGKEALRHSYFAARPKLVAFATRLRSNPMADEYVTSITRHIVYYDAVAGWQPREPVGYEAFLEEDPVQVNSEREEDRIRRFRDVEMIVGKVYEELLTHPVYRGRLSPQTTDHPWASRPRYDVIALLRDHDTALPQPERDRGIKGVHYIETHHERTGKLHHMILVFPDRNQATQSMGFRNISGYDLQADHFNLGDLAERAATQRRLPVL